MLLLNLVLENMLVLMAMDKQMLIKTKMVSLKHGQLVFMGKTKLHSKVDTKNIL